MVNVIKQEIEIDSALKHKIEFICNFCNTTPTIINGNIRKIAKYKRKRILEIIKEIKNIYSYKNLNALNLKEY